MTLEQPGLGMDPPNGSGREGCYIVVDQVLLVLLLQVMMAQEERGPMMAVILEMMVGILQIHIKVNIH